MSDKVRKHCKLLGLTKQETETYFICKGQCTICLLDGACTLQKKIKEKKDER